jgi:hypothetical protein
MHSFINLKIEVVWVKTYELQNVNKIPANIEYLYSIAKYIQMLYKIYNITMFANQEIKINPLGTYDFLSKRIFICY